MVGSGRPRSTEKTHSSADLGANWKYNENHGAKIPIRGYDENDGNTGNLADLGESCHRDQPNKKTLEFARDLKIDANRAAAGLLALFHNNDHVKDNMKPETLN